MVEGVRRFSRISSTARPGSSSLHYHLLSSLLLSRDLSEASFVQHAAGFMGGLVFSLEEHDIERRSSIRASDSWFAIPLQALRVEGVIPPRLQLGSTREMWSSPRPADR